MRSLLLPRFWVAHLLLVVAVGAAAALGVWQYDVWHAQRAAARVDVGSEPVLRLSSVMGGDDPLDGRYVGRRVSFGGTWMPQSTVYVAGRTQAAPNQAGSTQAGRRGYWVVTPVLIGRSAMPVVRGWAPKPADPRPATGEVRVTGYLEPSEGTGVTDADPRDNVIGSMRIASLTEHVDADLYSAYVVAKQSAPDATAGLARVDAAPVTDVSGTTALRNLLYAFQWWLFAGFAIFVWWRWSRDVLEADRLAEEWDADQGGAEDAEAPTQESDPETGSAQQVASSR